MPHSSKNWKFTSCYGSKLGHPESNQNSSSHYFGVNSSLSGFSSENDTGIHMHIMTYIYLKRLVIYLVISERTLTMTEG